MRDIKAFKPLFSGFFVAVLIYKAFDICLDIACAKVVYSIQYILDTQNSRDKCEDALSARIVRSLMKRRIIALVCLIVVVCTSFTLVACDLKIDAFAKELETPVVTINGEGIARWKAVEHAESYVCNLSGRQIETIYTVVQLNDGETVTVQAVGNGTTYKNSMWSTPKTYTKQGGQGGGEGEKTKLATPVVTISEDGLASWSAIANATMYQYIIGSNIGTTTETSIQLEANQSIAVIAIGGGEYADSDQSVLKRYESKQGENCDHVDANGDGVCDKCGQNMTSSCNHADKDNDEKCDNCGTSVIVNFNLYGINDLHGMYCDSDTQPGVDELTTFFKDKQATSNTVVLSSGDMWQGSSESNNTKGKLATEWLNYINCSSMTLGNHEFDWSTEKIKTNAQLANFPFLAINVYDNATNKRVEYCQPSTVVQFGDAKVGIIGAIGDCYSSISSSMCSDVNFKVKSELTTLVKEEANRLRAQGVDYIVYSLHDGGRANESMDWYDISLSNGYVDIVFEGHSHQSYAYADSYGVYHVQGGGYNSGISAAEVRLNFANQQSNTSNVQVIRNSVYSKYASDSIINDLVEKYKDEIGNPNEVVATLSRDVSSTAIVNKVAELYCSIGLQTWGSQYQIMLGGGYLKTRKPYSLSSGNVTVSQVQTLLPFDNKIVLCSLNGTELKNKFIYTSNTDYHIAYSAYGESVKDDVVYNPKKTYYIVTDTYTSDYHHLTVLATLGDNVFARDLLCDYLRGGGTF